MPSGWEAIQRSLAGDDVEADRRANLYRSRDPFPEIPPALLNSADIIDYAIATSMIHPFHAAEDRLKPASYEVPLEGDYQYWTAGGKAKYGRIAKGETFVLRRNSIAYVTLEPTFRVPDYIAARFNLKIRDIYRGVLVGTGPLVDPGFGGRLSIPLHNLTVNDYEFLGGEGLVWMEFTKLSPRADWSAQGEGRRRRGIFVTFPDDKRFPSSGLRFYLSRAHPDPIRSSIPEVVAAAGKASNEARNIRRIVTAGTVIGVLALIATVFSIYSLINDAHTQIDESIKERAELVERLQSQQRAAAALRARVEAQGRRINLLAAP